MLTSVAAVVLLLRTKIAMLHLLCQVYVRIGNIFLSFVPIFFLENKVKVHQYSDLQEVLQEPSSTDPSSTDCRSCVPGPSGVQGHPQAHLRGSGAV